MHVIWSVFQMGKTLSIKYPLKNALGLIRNNIMQVWKGKHRDKAKSNENRLFYKMHPFMTFIPLSDANFTAWEIKMLTCVPHKRIS